MIKPYTFAVILFLSFSSPLLFAQEITPAFEKKKWAVKMSPQHLLNHTVKMEVERVLSDQKFSFIFSPFFVSKDIWGDHKKDDIWGTGAEAMARLYFAKNNKNLKGFYSSFGVNYHYYNCRASYKGWLPIQEDGMEYIKMGHIKETLEVNRAGVLFLIGYQLNIDNTILFDFYHGFGLKQSFSPNGDKAIKRYDYHFMDYSYSGLDPRIGVKVGFVL